jgi:hypothetical protein
MMLLAALGGCMSTDRQPGTGLGGSYNNGLVHGPASIPGVQGPWGQPVAMAAPYTATPPSGEQAAREMMAHSVPMDLIQVGGTSLPGASSGVVQAGGVISPAGVPFQPVAPGAGLMPPPPPGAVAAVGALTGGTGNRFAGQRTEVRFVGPAGMKISWFAGAGAAKSFVANTMVAPTRYNFVQAAVYRLKLSNIPQHPGLDLYPTLEVVPSNKVTDQFLAHSAVPIRFTDEDFDQVAAGNYIIKVIYLPLPAYQDMVTIGPDEIVSTRLEPGVDPIAEAHRRGNILLVIRLGNINLEAPNTPPLEAPGQYGPGGMSHGHDMMPHGMMPPQMPDGSMPHSMMPAGPAGNMPSSLPPAPTGIPVSQLPDPGTLQPTQSRGGTAGSITAAKLASEMPPASPGRSADTSEKPWWATDSNYK